MLNRTKKVFVNDYSADIGALHNSLLQTVARVNQTFLEERSPLYSPFYVYYTTCRVVHIMYDQVINTP